ncbi:DEAD/DEAH box helicase [Acrocarpospora macrocephala]|uniref:DEAD/DEAH box helicase n=1 Tax=Acrocarpospora macrocephala TaxID=150177 RepID=UPI0012D2ED31|nr:DEAD/DEAH box helicase family protein [Acrocarpospora macrocephala]
MAGHYQDKSQIFTLFNGVGIPAWRAPQIGALGAVMAHWSLPRKTAALVSLPTGSGKTAVAAAAPYLCKANRVLVVVPSQDLRKQISAAFQSEDVLRRIGARNSEDRPHVMQLSGRIVDWSALNAADVVVALPNSISPIYYENNLPPRDLFDVVVVDEAHHAPASTWRAILDYFDRAHGLLITATPRRRDGRRLPGEHIYHYPLRQALEEGLYKPVRPVILDLPENASEETKDRLIAEEVVRIARTAEHATSTVLVRASSISRAEVLASLYSQLGLELELLHSKMSSRARNEKVEALRSGTCRAIAVVDMLGEGFDLPSIRIAGYHDKHKSLNATVQLIGRLVRVDDHYPQGSMLVTARDIDVFPQLQGAVRSLYDEDADWAEVLPGVIDELISDDIADRAYVRNFRTAPPQLSVEAIHPVCRSIIHEVPATGWEPSFLSGTIPGALTEGSIIRGKAILYSALSPRNDTLIIVTMAVQRPKWHAESGLDASTYDLHLISWQAARQTDQAHLLLINSADTGVIRIILEALNAKERVRAADPARIQDAFDSLPRISVSNVGLRNTYHGSQGVPSYRTFAGKGVERGLRDADTARGALGHAMAQITSEAGTFTAGIATGKSKMWQTRHVSLRAHEDFVVDLADRYWYPPMDGPGRLLPTVARGFRLLQFTTALIAAIDMHPALRGQGWSLANGLLLDELDLREDTSRARTDAILPLRAIDPANPSNSLWLGTQDISGTFHDSTMPVEVRRGYGPVFSLADIFTDRPPTIYFIDGRTVHGGTVYESRPALHSMPDIDHFESAWSGVDITAETRDTAKRKMRGISVHESLEQHLVDQPLRRRHRWVLCNDGPREIADYIVIEMDPGLQVSMELWHAKASHDEKPSLRVKDMQEVIAQAIKSRRWITDRSLWAELGARLAGRSSPAIRVVRGSERLLRVLCGENAIHPQWSIKERAPIITGCIGIAQPGLSLSELHKELRSSHPRMAAQQIRELLTVWHDATSPIGSAKLMGSK